MRYAATSCRQEIQAAIACTLVVCCLSIASAAERNSSYTAALSSIQSAELQQHVEYLADDDRAGREAGKAGGREAAEYLRARLAELGLQGAGVDGGYFQPFGDDYRNLLARIEGSDPELKDQYVVAGAHYDHVGRGSRQNSLVTVGWIHNGADDNASGTSALLELAEAFTMLPQPPRRSILFFFFDAEEKGLLGSKHWLARPTVPLEQVDAMLNVDMVGRLRNDKLIIFGSRTGYGLRRMMSRQNDGPDLAIDFSWDMLPIADHYPFFDRGIPVLMFNTGVHDQYHKQTDDAHLINSMGIERVTRLLFGTVYDLADQQSTPEFRTAARRETEKTRLGFHERFPGQIDRLGATWDEASTTGPGVRLSRIRWGSPAHRGTLRSGDQIVRIGRREISNSEELAAALMRADSPADVLVRRRGSREPVELSVELTGTPLRLGITWRSDDAEPGSVILTQVIPGSPAARAGLQSGDYVYQIDGRDFADELEFGQAARSLEGPIKMLVERDGRLRSVEINLESGSLDHAA